MKFGHFCLPTYFEDVDGDVGGFMRRFVDFLVSSEDAGFDMLFANEHHFDAYGGLVPSPTVMVTVQTMPVALFAAAPNTTSPSMSGTSAGKSAGISSPPNCTSPPV